MSVPWDSKVCFLFIHHAGKARVLSYSAPNICGVVIT